MQHKSSKKVPGFLMLRAHAGASEWKLKNGLRTIIYPRHDVPVVAVMITYRVGSRNEQLGNTGSTHILEHIMFKGSKRFDSKKHHGVADLIEARGASINATTWNDRTNYYAIVPTALVKTALELEADRMRNLLIRRDDLASEMIVVRNEYERGRNEPHRLLSSELWAAAFTVHPYHYDTIGIKEDIEGVTVEELRAFYDRFYWPNNATVSLVGDIDMKRGLQMVKEAFGRVPMRALPSQDIPVEPVQHGERRFEIKRPGTVNLLSISYKTPEGRHEDAAALTVLGAILGDGKGSLLHRALVNTSHVTNVSVFVSRFHDPGLIECMLTLGRKSRHGAVVRLFDAQIHFIARGKISHRDVLRAKALASTEALSSRASLSGFANALNEAIAFGDWTDAITFANEIEAVTKRDVVRVAKKYLIEDSRTVGSLIAL